LIVNLPAVVDRFTSALASSAPSGLFLADTERTTRAASEVRQ